MVEVEVASDELLSILDPDVAVEKKLMQACVSRGLRYTAPGEGEYSMDQPSTLFLIAS